MAKSISRPKSDSVSSSLCRKVTHILYWPCSWILWRARLLMPPYIVHIIRVISYGPYSMAFQRLTSRNERYRGLEKWHTDIELLIHSCDNGFAIFQTCKRHNWYHLYFLRYLLKLSLTDVDSLRYIYEVNHEGVHPGVERDKDYCKETF